MHSYNKFLMNILYDTNTISCPIKNNSNPPTVNIGILTEKINFKAK